MQLLTQTVTEITEIGNNWNYRYDLIMIFTDFKYLRFELKNSDILTDSHTVESLFS